MKLQGVVRKRIEMLKEVALVFQVPVSRVSNLKSLVLKLQWAKLLLLSLAAH